MSTSKHLANGDTITLDIKQFTNETVEMVIYYHKTLPNGTYQSTRVDFSTLLPEEIKELLNGRD